MIIAIDCIDTSLANKAAHMLAASIADQNASVEVLTFDYTTNLDDEDERADFAEQFNEFVVWSLVPALRKRNNAVIIPAYVLTTMTKYNSVPALNTIRTAVHPLYLADIQLVIDVTADSVYEQFSEGTRTWYSLEDLIRERDFITTSAENSARAMVFEYNTGDDFFDFVETLADYVWATAPTIL